jgi:hypothetical protein
MLPAGVLRVTMSQLRNRREQGFETRALLTAGRVVADRPVARIDRALHCG